jgi:hypothetical protein
MLPGGLVEFLKALAAGGIAGAAVVFGLARWLGDVWLGRLLVREKAKYDTELEQLRSRYAEKLESYKDALERSKELLKAQIDRSVFVTRAHFETEFEAYKKIFQDLVEVRLLMGLMHPTIRIAPIDETKEGRAKDLVANLQKLAEAHDKTVRTVENFAPFYPEEIFENLRKSLQIVRNEVFHLQTSGDNAFTSDWSQRGEKRVQDFQAAYQEASNAVRSRIATLAILPSSS